MQQLQAHAKLFYSFLQWAKSMHVRLIGDFKAPGVCVNDHLILTVGTAMDWRLVPRLLTDEDRHQLPAIQSRNSWAEKLDG